MKTPLQTRPIWRLLFVIALSSVLLSVQDVTAQSRRNGNSGNTSGGRERTTGREQVVPETSSQSRSATRSTPRARDEETDRDRGTDDRSDRARQNQPDNRERNQRPDQEASRGTIGRTDRTPVQPSPPRSGSVSRGGRSEDSGRDTRTGDNLRDSRRVVPATPQRHVSPPRRTEQYRRPNVQPRIHIDIRWPWEYRARRGWKPRYYFRQVVFIDAGWAHRRRNARIDVRTYYRHSLIRATPDRAEVEVYLDRIELFENGRFLGRVESIPGNLDRVRATVYRDGHVRFDRSLFLVGDPLAGFELISTRYYDDYLLNAYRKGHELRAGALDFRRHRVVPIRYSRLFDPYDFRGYVPISLLPDDEGWLLDYLYEGANRYPYYDSYDDYGYESYDYEPYFESPSGNDPYYEQGVLRIPDRPLQHRVEQQYRTQNGVEVRIQREIELERLE